MDLSPFFKSVIEQNNTSVIICDLDHTILYMNKAAADAESKRGGFELVGKNLKDCHNAKSCQAIDDVVAWFATSPENNRVHTFFNAKQNKDVYMVALRDEDGTLIGYYEKHEFRNRDDSPFYQLG